jgi:antitoxin MazE
VKTKIIRIGNSQGIRIPKPVLEEAGLGDEVELRITASGLVLEPLAATRSGWEAAARDLSAREPDASDGFLPTDFDETEWEW